MVVATNTARNLGEEATQKGKQLSKKVIYTDEDVTLKLMPGTKSNENSNEALSMRRSCRNATY